MRGLKYWMGKLIGPVIGGLLGGAIGMLIGFAVGFVLDALYKSGGSLLRREHIPAVIADKDPNDFIVGSILLAAAVVKADGEVDDLELSYVRTFLIDQFGNDQTDDYWHILTGALDGNFDLKKTTQQIRKTTSYETRLQLIHFLFGIANADYSIDEPEIAAVKVISIHLGIRPIEFESIKAMFYQEMNAYYKILEISPSARDSDVKYAYREMSKKYHPDKLEHLGEGVKKAATAKFLKVKEAYENIKRERGFH